MVAVVVLADIAGVVVAAVDAVELKMLIQMRVV